MKPISRSTLLRVGRLLTDSSEVDATIVGESERAAADPRNVLGHYVLLSESGRGGTATVYRAYDRTLQRIVAVKVISNVSEGQIRDFQSEFVAMARLRHANIVSVYDCGTSGDRLYCAMEWMEGQSLHDAIRRGAMDPRKAVAIARDIAAALEEAHKQGFLHMDVKPANILLAGDAPKLTDFSAARRLFSPPGAETVRGTPGFMAPEQLTRQTSKLDQRTDVFGLGMTLYALVTGSANPLPSSPPVTDRGLRQIIAKATAADPARRYASAGEMRAALTVWLEGRPWKRWFAVAAAGMLLTAGILYFFWLRSDSRIRRLEEKVQSLLAARRYDEARAPCEELLRLHPNHPEYERMQAAILLGSGDYEGSILAYEKLRSRNPQNPALQQAYLRALLGARFRSCRFHFGNYKRIHELVSTDSIEGCAGELAREKDWMGDFVRLFSQGDFAVFCKSFPQAVQELPYEFVILRAIGRYTAGRFGSEWKWEETADSDLAWARQCWPNRREVRLLSGLLALKEGLPENALEAARGVEGPDARRIEAMSYLLVGKPDLAIEILEALGADILESRVDLGICWFEKGNYAAAEKEFQLCLTKADSPGSYLSATVYYLSKMWIRQGRYAEVGKMVQEKLQEAGEIELCLSKSLENFALNERLSDTFYVSPDTLTPEEQGEEERLRRLLNEGKELLSYRSDGAEQAKAPDFDSDGKILHRNIATGRIAFESDREGSTEIWTRAWDGSELFRVTKHEGPTRYREPSFSPDGRWIVFVVEEGGSGALWKVRWDGTGLTRMTSGFDDRQPNWSPVEELIVFQRRACLHLMKPDGSDVRAITAASSNSADASWSPDGKWIVYSSKDDLYVIPAEGGDPVRITKEGAGDTAPSWSPDGNWISFASRSHHWRIAVPPSFQPEEVVDPATLVVRHPAQGAPLPLREVQFWIGDMLKPYRAPWSQALLDSPYDLVIVDPVRSMAGTRDYNDKLLVSKLKTSANHAGGPKIVIASLSLGAADRLREFWKPGWQVGNPSFLLSRDPGGWVDGYVVKFWDPAWKKILLGRIEEILADGFDGISLDWLFASELDAVKQAAAAEGKDAENEMVRLVGEIAAHARARKPGVLILGQNSPALGAYADYRNCIDGQIQDGLWFTWDSAAVGDRAPSPDYTRVLIQNLDLLQAAGKPIFTVDYARIPGNVSKAYGEARRRGYVPLVTTYGSEGLTATPPPGFTFPP